MKFDRRCLFSLLLLSFFLGQGALTSIVVAQPVYDLEGSISPAQGSLGGEELRPPPDEWMETRSDKPAISGEYLIADEKGLHRLDREGVVRTVLDGGEITTIARSGNYWYALGKNGVFASIDLEKWESRSDELPQRTIKTISEDSKSLDREIADLKDLEVDPSDPLKLVTATKDLIYLTRDGGHSWKNIGFPQWLNGLKAVAVASLPDTVVFVSHAVYGVYYYEADKPDAQWRGLSKGLEALETTANPDEVSDLKAVLKPGASASSGGVQLYASQTFRERLYLLDWAAKTWRPIWKGTGGGIDGLDPAGDRLRFVSADGIKEYDAASGQIEHRVELDAAVAAVAALIGRAPRTLVSMNDKAEPQYLLPELWLLEERSWPVASGPGGREGIYFPPNHFVDPTLLSRHLATIESRALDLAVVDMKDDYGRLRFTPQTPRLKAISKVFNPANLESLVAAMKAKGVWLVARIVVFKDPILAQWDGGKYAVWDSSSNTPWTGFYYVDQLVEPANSDGAAENPAAVNPSSPSSGEAGAEPVYEKVKTYYDERWVDPYSEDVWAYIGDIAQELIDRGFDEIQFDYIRFPTDGVNLGDAVYRWRDSGMDKESALISFLRYIRSRVDAPISVDIYGANGWYRTGARTGQEVEMLAPYVDVICPMYYPSHFEQTFLGQAPAVDRPYRIYYQGTLRTSAIARGQVIVRPYVQAFYLNVSYDRSYYNPAYVLSEVQGVRDAGAPGFTYWNNSGRYEDIPSRAEIGSRLNILPK